MQERRMTQKEFIIWLAKNQPEVFRKLSLFVEGYIESSRTVNVKEVAKYLAAELLRYGVIDIPNVKNNFTPENLLIDIIRNILEITQEM